MMRVVVNQLAALGVKTGIGHYAVQLLRCLREQAGEDQIDGFPLGVVRHVREACARVRPLLEFGRAQTPAAASAALPAGWRTQVLRGLRQFGRSVIAQHFQLTYRLKGYDLYHETNFIPLPGDYATVVTIHDLSVLLHPEWHPRDRVAYFERHFCAGLSRCQHFLAISEFGRQEVIRTLQIPPARVTRTYMGIRPGLGPMPQSEVDQVLRRLQLPRRYLLYVGTIEPRKNLALLLTAYCSLPESLRAQWPLVLVGSWGWNAAPVADYFHDEARHRGVIHLGYLAEAHLPAVYNGARALVYPSHYEGFGLPPVEMMACGGAVLASRAGALVETVGSRAHLVDAGDQGGWRTAMIRALTDDDWWQSLRRGVCQVAQPYTWERCAADTLRVYRALGTRPASASENPGAAALRPTRMAG
jgi:alpha-1,3-rhamnosyl/mannosyltransferase